MACSTLTKGRVKPCKNSVGGLRNVYFADFNQLDFTIDGDGDVSAISLKTGVSAADLFKYEVRGSSSFTQNIQTSVENGTTSFEQVLELSLHKLSSADHKEIKLLSFGRPHIFVEDYNGNVFLAGKEHGMEVTGGTIVTGAAMGDMSGYTLTFTGMELVPSEFIAKAGAAPDGQNDLEAAFTDGEDIEVVAGSDF